ncbi:MAG TPA: hypothetical protein VJ914_20395 [Pseudonocardiaceae bacterium]|nr:hypothetical protein [Pseudonocardiaceae bacterium]
MWLSTIWRWLIGRGPVHTMDSRLPRQEIVRRAEAEFAEQRAQRKARSLPNTIAGAGARWISGDWDTERLLLALGPANQAAMGSSARVPALHVTFEPTGTGTRLNVQVRYAAVTTIMFLVWCVVVIGIIAIGHGDPIPGVSKWFIGLGMLVLGVASAVGARHKERLDIAVLGSFLARCADLGAGYEPGGVDEADPTR